MSFHKEDTNQRHECLEVHIQKRQPLQKHRQRNETCGGSQAAKMFSHGFRNGAGLIFVSLLVPFFGMCHSEMVFCYSFCVVSRRRKFKTEYTACLERHAGSCVLSSDKRFTTETHRGRVSPSLTSIPQKKSRLSAKKIHFSAGCR